MSFWFGSSPWSKIGRMLDRLDLVRAQITTLEQERDVVLENEAPDRAGEMIQQLATLRGIGVALLSNFGLVVLTDFGPSSRPST